MGLFANAFLENFNLCLFFLGVCILNKLKVILLPCACFI